jgi:hypothetical protein
MDVVKFLSGVSSKISIVPVGKKMEELYIYDMSGDLAPLELALLVKSALDSHQVPHKILEHNRLDSIWRAPAYVLLELPRGETMA